MSHSCIRAHLAPATAGLLAALALYPGPCVAAGQAAEPLNHIAVYGTYENDMYFDTDRYYTNGIQLSVKRGKDARGALAKAWTSRVCGWLGCEDAQLLTIHSHFGQLMYTPGDITQRAPQPLDRPWAGLLYVEQAYSFLSRDKRTLTTLSAEIGVTGSASLAEQTQKLVHKIKDRPPPQGWDNQIGGSLALMATAERRTAQAALSFELGHDVQLNTATYWKMAVGNIMTYAGGGVAVVVGKDLPLVSPPPPGIGTKLVRETVNRTSCMAAWLQCTGFASLEARMMAYNVFLDGRLLRDDPEVKRRNVVADLVAGLRVDFPRTRTSRHGPWFAQFKISRRTREFRSSIPVVSHKVGALTIGTEF